MSKPNKEGQGQHHPETNQANQNQGTGQSPGGGKPHGQGHGGGKPSGGHKGGDVVVMPGMCMADGCKTKSQKANFCMEHFDWFKEGLVTKEGRKPTDFDKKYFDYMRRKNKRAA